MSIDLKRYFYLTFKRENILREIEDELSTEFQN